MRRSSNGTDDRSLDEELDDGASHIFAVIQHARRVSAAEQYEARIGTGHGAVKGQSHGDGQGSGERVEPGYGQTDGGAYETHQAGPSTCIEPFRPDHISHNLSQPRSLGGMHTSPDPSQAAGTIHQPEAEDDDIRPSIDLGEMGVLQMQWAMPPDRTGIFPGKQVMPKLSRGEEVARAAAAAKRTASKGEERMAGDAGHTGRDGLGLESAPARTRNTFGLASTQHQGLSDSRQAAELELQPEKGTALPVPAPASASADSASTSSPSSKARRYPTPISPDVPKDVDGDGRSIYHRPSMSIYGAPSIRSRTRTALHGQQAAGDRDFSGPSGVTRYEGSSSVDAGPSTGTGSSFSIDPPSGQSAGKARSKGHGAIRRDKSTKSDKSQTSTRALFDGASGHGERPSHTKGSTAFSNSDEVPTSAALTGDTWTTGRTGASGKTTDSAGTGSSRSGHSRGTSKSLKAAAQRARTSRWTVHPSISSLPSRRRDRGRREREEDGWEDCTADPTHSEERCGEYEVEQDQVGLLMYDGSTSEMSGHLVQHGNGKGKAKRVSVLHRMAPSGSTDKLDGDKGKGDEEIMDLGLLVGRAAVLERILKAGKRISNNSLYHTTHRPYTPSRLSRSSLAQSFNSALGSAFGLGSHHIYGTSSVGSMIADGTSQPRTPFDDLPPTPRVPEHFLQQLRKKHLVRSMSGRSGHTTRTGRTALSAMTGRTGNSSQSGHTARAKRHVGRTMLRLTGAGAPGGSYTGMPEEGDDISARYAAYGEDDTPPLPSNSTAGPERQFDVEAERKRLARRVKGDTDGWRSFTEIGDVGKDSVSERRPSAVAVGADEPIGVVVQPPPTVGQGSRAKTTSDVTHQQSAPVPDRQPDTEDHRQTSTVVRRHTAMMPSCTRLDMNMDVAALYNIGGRAIMAPPQCVDDSIIVSATADKIVRTARTSGREGRARSRTISRSGEHTLSRYTQNTQTSHRNGRGVLHEKGPYSKELGTVAECDEGMHDYGDGRTQDAGLGWRAWVRKRKMWLIIGAGVVVAGLLMLVGILVWVLA